MKIFLFLSAFVFAQAEMTQGQENAAKAAFHRFDHDHKGDLTSGGVYAALSSLDHKLTEEQLQKAAGHNKRKVTLKQFLNIYAKLEGGGNTASKYPKDCKNWFDGCNHCILKKGKSIGCTEMYCATKYDAPKKKGYCTVYVDGRRCTSPTSCSKKKTQYNCYTREVWSAAKKKYCCKTKKMGCSANPPKKKSLKPGQVCYAFYEANPGAAVNRKNDCPKGYKCASNPDVISFNTVMHCMKQSSQGSSKGGIPKDCTMWFDGCNNCFVRNGKSLGCTKRYCMQKKTPKCMRRTGRTSVVHYDK